MKHPLDEGGYLIPAVMDETIREHFTRDLSVWYAMFPSSKVHLTRRQWLRYHVNSFRESLALRLAPWLDRDDYGY